MAKQPVIITCAITGAIHTPTMSDALPYTADDIAAQAIAAAEAGASILHLHARRPHDGGVTIDTAVFETFLPRVKQSTDAVINLTTGGSLTNTIEERIAPALRFCSCRPMSTSRSPPSSVICRQRVFAKRQASTMCEATASGWRRIAIRWPMLPNRNACHARRNMNSPRLLPCFGMHLATAILPGPA